MSAGFPHVVDQATKNPNTCAVLGRDEGPFLDVGALPFTDPYVYISHPGFLVLCEASGWAVDSVKYQEAVEALERAEARISELEAEVAEADTALQGVYALRNKGFVDQNKPGRKVAA